MSSGTMVIEDKNGALHDFFRTYVEISCKLNEGQNANIDKPKFIASTKAYGRISSHFKEYFKYGSQPGAKRPAQYGIDLDNPIKTFTENVKPNDIRSHFLFGKLDPSSDLMFIKFETHGLGGPKEAAIHGLNFVKRFFEKAIEKKQTSTKSKTKAETDQKQFEIRDRRENTPKEILKEYKKILDGTDLSKKDKTVLLEKAKARGISAIVENIKSNRDSKELKSLHTKIENTYGNLDIRVGNEIIFRNADIPKEAPTI
jgi:hypothetical protein